MKSSQHTVTTWRPYDDTDHRAVDGALGAQLMSAFRDLIERPAGMLA